MFLCLSRKYDLPTSVGYDDDHDDDHDHDHCHSMILGLNSPLSFQGPFGCRCPAGKSSSLSSLSSWLDCLRVFISEISLWYTRHSSPVIHHPLHHLQQNHHFVQTFFCPSKWVFCAGASSHPPPAKYIQVLSSIKLMPPPDTDLSPDCRLVDVLSGAEDGLRKFSQENQNFVLGGAHLSGVRSSHRNLKYQSSLQYIRRHFCPWSC